MALNFPSIGRSLKHRNFRLDFFGQLVSLIGTWVTTIATSWLIYRLTASPFFLANLNAAGMLPTLLVTPFIGPYLERWDRRKVLLLTQSFSMVQSFTLAALTLLGAITVPLLFLLVVAQGIVNAIDLSARQIFLREVVPSAEDLGNAIALNAALFHGSRLIGPAIGGIVIGLTNEGICFLLDGLSFLAVIIALVQIHPQRRPAEPTAESAVQRLLEGWRYAVGFLPIGALILFVAVVSFSVTPYISFLPIVAKDVLHGGPTTLGILMSSSGCGALLGAIYLASRDSIRGLGRIIIGAGCGLGTMLMALSLNTNCAVAVPILFVIGLSMVLLLASTNTIVQTLCEPSKLGRVMSLYLVAFTGISPIGGLFAGVGSHFLSATGVIRLGGILILLATGLLASRISIIRAQAHARRQEIVVPIG